MPAEPAPIVVEGVDATIELAARLARLARAGDVIAITGELGAGKTQFVRGLARGLGIDPMLVSSPTFVTVQEYESEDDGSHGVDRPVGAGPRVLVHVDAYRLDSPLQWSTTGIALPDPEALVAIEWPERIDLDRFPAIEGRLDVSIDHAGRDRRLIRLTPRRRWINALAGFANES